jgi:hypothetical protein
MRETRWALALLVVVSLFTLTCGRERTKEVLIDGFLFKEAYTGDPISYDRWIEAYDKDGLPQIPTATMNGRQLEMISWNPIHALYEDTLGFKTDTNYDVEVEHYWGRATVRIAMPADFRITSPAPSFVLDPDLALPVVWQKSRGSTWYWLALYLGYDFIDTLSETLHVELAHDTILSDTVCTYEAHRFFSSLVRQVLGGDGEAVIWAAAGPQTNPGATSNVQGHGYGYVSAANQPPEAGFLVGRPPASRLDRTELVRNRKDGFVRRLRQMTGITDTLRLPGPHRP